ncbi:TIR domain-containing protein [Nonomuraea fuscirosea]|uniref:TIR domain-containing protein n=1 Tax=Nonomuraea fuscirosea TaxID=1291556 RepID=UPI00343C864B
MRWRNRRKVFLAHGRWYEAVDAMKVFLGSLDVEVVDWDAARLRARREGQHATDILDAGFRMSYATVVFFSPDDVAALHPALAEVPERLSGQPRPNVLFEAGYAWALNRRRTLFVDFGTLRWPSDLAGVDHVLFDGSAKSRRQFVDRLKNVGVPADISGAAWLSAGRFPRPLPEVGAAHLRTRRNRP